MVNSDTNLLLTDNQQYRSRIHICKLCDCQS